MKPYYSHAGITSTGRLAEASMMNSIVSLGLILTHPLAVRLTAVSTRIRDVDW